MMITESAKNVKESFERTKISNRKMVYKMSLNKQTVQKQLVKRRQAMICNLESRSQSQTGMDYGSYSRKLVHVIRSSKKLKTFGLNSSGYQDLNDAESARLRQCIKSCHSIQRFNIQIAGGTNSTTKGLVSMGQALKRLPSLKCLRFEVFNAMHITTLGLSHFIRNLKKFSLQGLQIYWKNIFGNLGLALSALGKSLKRASSLKTLDVHYNSYPCNDNEALPLLEALKRIDSLESLSLALMFQGITDESLSKLSNALKHKTALRSLKLDCANCQQITGKGVTSVNEGLKELTQLESLDLNFSECEKIEEIESVDLRKLTSLKKVHFGFRMCNNLDESGLVSLSKTLKGLSSLQEIRIQLTGSLTLDANFQMEILGGSKINDEGLLGLMEVLENTRGSLHNLDLNFEICRSLSDTHLAALGKCLMGLSALQKLTLNFNNCVNIGDEGTASLSEGLKILVSLRDISLNFDKCQKLTDVGLSSLARGLKDLTSLEEINLQLASEFDQSTITNQGFLSLSKSFESLVFLRKLTMDFSRAKISDEGLEELVKSLERLKGLQNISLDIFDCSQVTEKEKESLKRKLERKFSQAVIELNT